MPNLPVLSGLLLVLGSAFFGGLLAKKLGQPIILGYLLAGLLASGLISQMGLPRENLNLLAEIGSSLLLFTLGLEFSFKKIHQFRKPIIGGALFGIFFTLLLGTFFLKLVFHLETAFALVMAGAFSLSSSAIVVKLLEEKKMQESLAGEIMLGWLLIQDLAVLPLIGLFILFFRGGGVEINLPLLIKAWLIFGLTVFLALKLAPKLADFVAGFRNRELLLLFAVSFVFLFATLTAGFGFSFALGAFLAGVVLSQTDENLAIFSEIRPLRDVFLVIFFVSLGLTLEPQFIFLNWGKILLISTAVLFLKVFLAIFVLGYFGYHAKTILKVALSLAQAGEFSFTLAAAALAGGFLASQDYLLVVSVTLLTMVLTPWLFSLADPVYRQSEKLFKKLPWIYKKFYTNYDHYLPLEELPFADHVVILGYGRVGKWVGNILEKSKIPYLVVEYNPHLVRSLRLKEKKVVFGDPTDLEVLDFAQVDKAKMVVLAIPDPLTQKLVVANCQSLNPRVKIVCRSHLEEDFQELKTLGVQEIIQPEFEAALSISHRVLQNFGFSREEVLERLKEVKKEHGKI